MANFIFQMSEFDKETGFYEEKTRKVKAGSHKDAKLKENKLLEEFKKTHEGVYYTGVVQVMDEDLFNAIK